MIKALGPATRRTPQERNCKLSMDYHAAVCAQLSALLGIRIPYEGQKGVVSSCLAMGQVARLRWFATACRTAGAHHCQPSASVVM